MPPATNSNSLLPGSSSSVSLNESPNEEINYDSDISEDDHAIAEGGDDDEYDYDEENDDGDDEDDEEEEPDEGFAVEVSTLTGSTFNIMIHPSDTVEVLKTRIAFQEGISPADQNLLLDSTTGCSNNATVQELNIDRNSKLTLVTNVVSGVPFKSTTTSSTATSGVSDSYSGQLMGMGEGRGGGGEDPLQSSSPSFKLAPTIKRNYHNSSSNNNGSNNHCSNNQQKHSSSSSSTSLRLPKILTTSTYLDKNSNIIGSSSGNINNNGSSMYKNGQVESQQQQQRPRLDEREWMKSLFNKVVNQNEENEPSEDRNGDDFHNSSAAKIVIDIDSTNGTCRDGITPTTTTTTTTAVHPPHGARVSTRYIGTKYAPEEDGSILVVQGDDGVILIIQKNTDQVLEDSFSDSNNNNNNNKTNRFTAHQNNRNNHFGQVGDNGSRGEGINGRIGRLGRYTQSNTTTNTEISVDSPSMRGGSSYRKSRYQQDNKLVHDKIKENAVTLEKMRQVRNMMAQQKRARSNIRGSNIAEDVMEYGLESKGKAAEAVKTLEFPRISEGVFRGNKPLGIKNGGGGGGVGYKSRGGMSMGGARKSARARNSRSINSSKMSLNRLIAELYLQTKRKDRHSFQPGQPPYTDQQLLRYVQLKTAILLDEQKKNKTEACTKCQLDDDWSYNESATYLVPTVVMNRYKRFANGRNSKSLDKWENEEDDMMTQAVNIRRKSLIPVVASSSKLLNKNVHNNQQTMMMTNGGNVSGGGRGSYIPRLILVNRERETEPGVNRNNPSSVATTASTISGRSSTSMTNKLSNGAYQFSSGSSSNYGGQKNMNQSKSSKAQYSNDWNDEEEEVLNEDDNDCMCDTTIIITNNNGVGSPRTFGNNGRPTNWNGGTGGGRPTFKVNPKMCYSKNNNVCGRSSSRPGSSKANSAAKKGSVRCQTCKKKVGIACRYQCRCGLTFCSVHRYPETHECTFDYKTEGRNKLRESNPVIVARKIQEI